MPRQRSSSRSSSRSTSSRSSRRGKKKSSRNRSRSRSSSRDGSRRKPRSSRSSKSTSKRSKRSRSRSRSKRSSRSNSRSRRGSSRSRSASRDTLPKPVPVTSSTALSREDTERQRELDILNHSQREKAIKGIESAGFQPATFSSSASQKIASIALPDEVCAEAAAKNFSFGTAMEKAATSAVSTTQATKTLDDLCHPRLFGDERLREERWISHLFKMRQEIMTNKE